MTTTTTAATEPPANYEQALAELERLIASMEAGQMPLEQLLAHYRRGSLLLGFCRERLDAVEEQVKILENEQLRPFFEPAR